MAFKFSISLLYFLGPLLISTGPHSTTSIMINELEVVPQTVFMIEGVRTIKPVHRKTIVNPELHCIAHNIYFESRNQKALKDKVVVAQVVLNRVKDEKYPSEICAVVKARAAFSWYWDGKPDKPDDNYIEEQAWSQAYVIAQEVLEGKYPDYSDGAILYHAYYVTPKDWDFSKLVFLSQHGAHRLYKRKT